MSDGKVERVFCVISMICTRDGERGSAREGKS